MARFSFRKRASEDEETPPEGEIDLTQPEEDVPETPDGDDQGGGRSRRLFILLGVGIFLVGGFYIANQLFLAPPPPPPATPMRPAVPTPPVKAPAPAPPAKEAAPTPPAPAKAPVAPVTPPAKTEAKAPPPAPGAPSAGPAKSDTGKGVKAEAAPSPAKSGTPTGAKPAPTAPVGFSLQVAAMVVEENAEGLKRKLDSNGFQAVIRKGTAFVTKHVVTVGEPTGKREAEELARRLTVDGFPSQLLGVGDKYAPQIGAFFNLDEAIDLARELQKKNYYPKITSKPANTVVFQVRHGKFDSRSAAVKRGEELKAKGYNFLVVRE
ncbi:MAG TPA: SPOR domain-containing protein [Candidatus Methylomirabilis sp.]|nr:SPOR domain-containing protein [Candidatus Methylomirabilis sp.]